MRELVALSNPRDILRLPEAFSRDDLNVAYRRAAKRGAPELGGTEGWYGPSIRRGMC